MKLPKITAFSIATLFLLIDLGYIYGIIYVFYGQISYQESVLNGMINAHPANASLYIQASWANQIVNIAIVIAVLVFLAYISKEPIGLLRVMVNHQQCEKKAQTKK